MMHENYQNIIKYKNFNWTYINFNTKKKIFIYKKVNILLLLLKRFKKILIFKNFKFYNLRKEIELI